MMCAGFLTDHRDKSEQFQLVWNWVKGLKENLPCAFSCDLNLDWATT